MYVLGNIAGSLSFLIMHVCLSVTTALSPFFVTFYFKCGAQEKGWDP